MAQELQRVDGLGFELPFSRLVGHIQVLDPLINAAGVRRHAQLCRREFAQA